MKAVSTSILRTVAIAIVVSECAAAETVPHVEAAPGTIVRWAASDIERCGMDERQWSALGDACWYPIDLLRSEGVIDVSRWRNGTRERARIVVGSYPYPVQHITIENEAQVHLSPENLERVGREQKLVAALWASEGEAAFTLPLASPLADRGSSGRFGSRRFFNNEPRSPHTGADYAAAEGTPVVSVAAGRVVLAQDLFFSGNSLFIDHGGGLVSMYFHLSEMLVVAGDEVSRAQRIGRVGATGRATGPHLHFGVRWRGSRVDPELLLGSPDATPQLP